MTLSQNNYTLNNFLLTKRLVFRKIKTKSINVKFDEWEE